MEEHTNSDDNIDIVSVVEGLLYVVGDDGISLEELSKIIKKEIDECEKILLDIKNRYNDSSHGIELVNYGKAYKVVTKKDIAGYIQTLFAVNKTKTLSQSALETLAIIAYKQPITRIEIEELRGVGAEMMLKKLLARNLIKEAGRSEAPGKPILYEVSEEFMDSFGLSTLKELPELMEFNNDEENDNLF